MSVTLNNAGVVLVTTTYTVADPVTVVLGNGTFSVNLPAAAGRVGRPLIIKNIGSGTLTVDGNSTELIDSAQTATIAAGEAMVLGCDGTKWHTLTGKGPQGPQGYQGYQGTTGNPGFGGTQGAQGSAGSQGLRGYQGVPGTGVQGPRGFQGTPGSQGSQGPQGYQGLPGPTGYTGPQGYQGAAGTQPTGLNISWGNVMIAGSWYILNLSNGVVVSRTLQ